MTLSYRRLPLNSYNGLTVSKFLNDKRGFVENISVYNFLMSTNGEAGSNLKNIEVIYQAFSQELKDKYYHLLNNILIATSETAANDLVSKSSLISDLGQWPIQNSPVVIIPNENFNDELMNVRGANQFLEQKSIQGFWSEKLRQIITDKLYVRDENLSIASDDNFSIEIINQNIKVWVWCRALNKLINLSPFILDLDTQKTDVGNFSFSLNPLHSDKKYFNTENEDTVNYFNLKKDGKFQIDYFHRNLQQNDIVFIRFERLKIEKEDNTKPYFDFEINSSELPGQVWDMIGLIDTCTVNSSFNSTDYGVKISGRDLLKLLVEDGSYFLSLAYIQSESDKFVLTFSPGTKGYQRNIDGQFDPKRYTFLNSARKIDDSIGFIINQLSNLGVIDDKSNLLNAYGDSRRSSSFQLTGTYGNEISKYTVEGIWQIVKIFVDKQLDSRRIVDQSSVSQQSPLLDQFMKICQEPFVEFYGDTYGDEFNFVARQPPFTKEAILGFIESNIVTQSSLKQSNNNTKQSSVDNSGANCIIDINSSDILNYNLQWDERYYAWYQVEPNDQIFGQKSEFASGGIIPIVFFSKIAETYGNHRKIVQDQYLTASLTHGSEFNLDLQSYRPAILNDLKFIIDTNIYLPFTRKGTITLSKGDRRIKKGIFIRLAPTGEICYVDGVSNSVRFSGTNVDRSTTLTVSRCMIERYIKGDKGYEHDGSEIPNTTFSYFNIVDTNLIVSNLLKSEKVLTSSDQSTAVLSSQINYDFSVIIPTNGGRGYRNHSPGDMKWPPNIKNMPFASGRDGEFITYATNEDGFKALMAQILIDSNPKRNESIRDFFEKYLSGEKLSIIEDRILRTVMNLNSAGIVVIESSLMSDYFINVDNRFQLAKIIAKDECKAIVTNKPDSTGKDIVKDLVTPIIPAVTTPEYTIYTNNQRVDKYNFGLNDDQFDFFQQRKQLNILDK